MKVFQIWPLLTNRAVNENALQVFSVYWWYLVIDCKLLILTVVWFMLTSNYFANCTPLSMKWTVLHKGKDFKEGTEELREKAFAGAFAAHWVPTQQLYAGLLGESALGNSTWSLGEKEELRELCAWMELSLSASGFLFIPTHPFRGESDVTWVTVNNFPLMVQVWNDTFFFSFSPSANIHGHLKCCLNKQQFWKYDPVFQSLLLGCREWLFCFVMTAHICIWPCDTVREQRPRQPSLHVPSYS